MKALVGGTVYVDARAEPLCGGTVIIDGRKIVEVGLSREVALPVSAEIIDCSAFTITPGFWNCHVHFMERKWADASNIPAAELTLQFRDMLTQYGFTTAFDLSSPWENTRTLRDRVESGEVAGPRILSTGLGLLPPDSRIPPQAMAFMGWMERQAPEVGTPEQARVTTQELLESGVDAIKLFLSAPSGSILSEGVIAAATDEAHRRGKLVFAHPNTAADIVRAVKAGVDIIGHTTPRGDPWDELGVIGVVQQHRVALTPTLWIWKWYARHERRTVQDRIVSECAAQLRDWRSAGGDVLFGTDLGAVDPDPTEEYVLMRDAGMSFRDILASLTTVPAQRFGRHHQLGRIAAGFEADVVVLGNSPAKDIRALADVQYTFRSGRLIYSA
jgi:imidazolonepropionase-like amidohydrolase